LSLLDRWFAYSEFRLNTHVDGRVSHTWERIARIFVICDRSPVTNLMDSTPALLRPGSAAARCALPHACEHHLVRQVLVVIGGLPAVGKSTIATLLGAETCTPYLRVDRIEHAIVESSALSHPLGPAGYAVAHTLADEQLRLGLDVIVECVNPLSLTRDAWVRTATAAGAGILEVEVVCSDEAEHRRRVEARSSDVEGLMKPTWAALLNREYELWGRVHLVVDSATTSAESAARIVASRMMSAKAAES
jgi:predicted kinase